MGWLERWLGGSPNDERRQAEALNKKAVECMARNELDRAEELLQSVIRMVPNMAAAHHNLGALYMNQQRYAQALKSMRRAVRLDPKDIESQVAIARIRGEMGEKEESLAEYVRICEQHPEDWRSHVSLGNALVGDDRLEEAIEHLEKAVRLGPREELTHLVLATSYERLGRLQEAIREYRAVRVTTGELQNRSAALAKVKELEQRLAEEEQEGAAEQEE